MQLNFFRHPGNRGMAGTAAELLSLVPSLGLSRKKCHGIDLLQVIPAFKLDFFVFGVLLYNYMSVPLLSINWSGMCTHMFMHFSFTV